MKCGFCRRGAEVEAVCEKLWYVNNAKTCCVAHWKCMVRHCVLVFIIIIIITMKVENLEWYIQSVAGTHTLQTLTRS